MTDERFADLERWVRGESQSAISRDETFWLVREVRSLRQQVERLNGCAFAWEEKVRSGELIHRDALGVKVDTEAIAEHLRKAFRSEMTQGEVGVIVESERAGCNGQDWFWVLAHLGGIDMEAKAHVIEMTRGREQNERERIEEEGARDWHWSEVQDAAKWAMAGMLADRRRDGCSGEDLAEDAADFAEALIAEVARRRENEEASDG